MIIAPRVEPGVLTSEQEPALLLPLPRGSESAEKCGEGPLASAGFGGGVRHLAGVRERLRARVKQPDAQPRPGGHRGSGESPTVAARARGLGLGGCCGEGACAGGPEPPDGGSEAGQRGGHGGRGLAASIRRGRKEKRRRGGARVVGRGCRNAGEGIGGRAVRGLVGLPFFVAARQKAAGQEALPGFVGHACEINVFLHFSFVLGS